MSVKVEKLEKNMAKLTVEVPAEEFDKALVNAYNKTKGRFNLPGFRKGKAPMAMIEKMYGVQVFFEDAVDELLDKTYPDAMKESELEIVTRPEIDVVEIGKGKNLVYTATVAVKPEVTLGDYKGVEVKKASTKVLAAEVKAEIEKVQDQNARLVVVDRAAKNGDTVTIDFTGSIDGKEFAGGKGEDYPLTLGTHTFIDTFEEQIVGHKTGEELDVNVTFPAEYGAKELAGKAAVFKVVIKEIKEKQVPKADDEFAAEVSEFETMDEYKADLKKKLQAEKEKKAVTENENAVVEKVVENATMEIPDALVNQNVNNMYADYARRMQQQGIPMDQYLQITGQTEQDIKEQMKPSALKRIETRLVLEAVVKAENIEVTDADIDAELQKIADQYKVELDKIKAGMGEYEKAQMKEDLAVQKAVDFLVSEAKLK